MGVYAWNENLYEIWLADKFDLNLILFQKVEKIYLSLMSIWCGLYYTLYSEDVFTFAIFASKVIKSWH